MLWRIGTATCWSNPCSPPASSLPSIERPSCVSFCFWSEIPLFSPSTTTIDHPILAYGFSKYFSPEVQGKEVLFPFGATTQKSACEATKISLCTATAETPRWRPCGGGGDADDRTVVAAGGPSWVVVAVGGVGFDRPVEREEGFVVATRRCQSDAVGAADVAVVAAAAVGTTAAVLRKVAAVGAEEGAESGFACPKQTWHHSNRILLQHQLLLLVAVEGGTADPSAALHHHPPPQRKRVAVVAAFAGPDHLVWPLALQETPAAASPASAAHDTDRGCDAPRA